MHINRLSLTGYRNFARLDIDIEPGAIMLVGDNAQGKTSILEAIYYLSSFVSLQTDSDRQLINFLTAKDPLAVTRIVADYLKEGDPHRIEVRIISESNAVNITQRLRKEILIDGVKRKVSEAIGIFNAVLFMPQMLEIIEGSPENRRRFINLALSQIIDHYAASLVDYNNALTQRNALLKILNERGGDKLQLDYWDEQVATSGTMLIMARIQALQELENIAIPVHKELTKGEEILRFSYQPSFDPYQLKTNQFMLPVEMSINRSGLSLKQALEGFINFLSLHREEDIQRGITQAGPHRDELRFLGNGIDIGTYGSRGQVRTVMMAIKIAEALWIKEKRGYWPILLMDEVLAELDKQRRADLLLRLNDCEQIFLTTTDANLFTEGFIKKAHYWLVKEGSIKAVS